MDSDSTRNRTLGRLEEPNCRIDRRRTAGHWHLFDQTTSVRS